MTANYIEGSLRFHDELILKASRPSGWILASRFRYRTNIGRQRDIQVPVGFNTDLASIPRIVRSLITKDGPNRYAAVLHDYLYSLAGGGPKGTSREDADTIFKEAMIDIGVPRWKIFLLYRGVRVGGWVSFNRHKRKKDNV